MAESNLDMAQLNELLNSEWLDEEYKTILKKTIERLIKLMPDMMTKLEEAFKEE